MRCNPNSGRNLSVNAVAEPNPPPGIGILETTVFKKLVPVMGLLAFVAGPVFAADSPPAAGSAAVSTDTGKSAHKSTHKHHHKKTTSSAKQPS